MLTLRTLTGIALGLLLLSSVQTDVFASSYQPLYQTAATTYGYYSGTSSTAINYVKSHGIMTGYANGTFGENDLVNRAQFATVVMRVYSRSVPNLYTTVLPFYDTARNAWYTTAVVYVYGNGLMTGYSDNTFRPDTPVDFDEAAKVLATMYRLNLNGSNGQWYDQYVHALADRNAIPLSITSLTQPLTRGQLADIVYRLDSNDTSQPSQTYGMLVNGTTQGQCSNGNNIMVTINPNDNNPHPGDTFSYSIKLQNCSGQNQRITVTATLDSQTYFSSASNGGYSNGRTVRWNNINVNDGGSQTVTLTVRVDGASNGDQINLSVNATDSNGDTDNETSTVTVSAVSNCYYNQYGQYVCNNNNNNCYYNSNGQYICNNQSNCYYDNNGNYICNNNNNNCYYNSNGQYICNNQNNCYYDQYGNYICNNNNNNCYYDQYGNYVCSNNPTGDVSVSVSPENGMYVEPGDTVTYDVRIRNNTSTDRSFTMHANFSSDLVYQSASDSVTLSDSQNLNWSNIFIDHYQTELVTIKLRVRNTAYNGEPLTLTVNANNGNGSSDNESSTVYVQNANNNNTCYYDQYGHYVCNNNNNNNNCYYNSNGQYVCNNNNCYYDQYGRYVCNNNQNNCYYNQNSQYVCNNTGTLSVNANANTSTVQPGAIVHSYITVYNNDGDQYVDLTANLDSNLTYYSASLTPDSHSNTQVVWNHVFLPSHQTLYLTLDTRVSSFASQGEQIQLNIQAAGNTNTATNTEYMTVSY